MTGRSCSNGLRPTRSGRRNQPSAQTGNECWKRNDLVSVGGTTLDDLGLPVVKGNELGNDLKAGGGKSSIPEGRYLTIEGVRRPLANQLLRIFNENDLLSQYPTFLNPHWLHS